MLLLGEKLLHMCLIERKNANPNELAVHECKVGRRSAKKLMFRKAWLTVVPNSPTRQLLATGLRHCSCRCPGSPLDKVGPLHRWQPLQSEPPWIQTLLPLPFLPRPTPWSPHPQSRDRSRHLVILWLCGRRIWMSSQPLAENYLEKTEIVRSSSCVGATLLRGLQPPFSRIGNHQRGSWLPRCTGRWRGGNRCWCSRKELDVILDVLRTMIRMICRRETDQAQYNELQQVKKP